MNRPNPLLVLRVTWMDHYEGPEDYIGGVGGSYVVEHGEGAEMWNFEKRKGRCFGYARVGESGIDLRKIGLKKSGKPRTPGEEKGGVDIVFIATRPKPEKGQVVVGWYKNATVFHKEYREKEFDMDREYKSYLCYVDENDAVLIPSHARTVAVPKGAGYPGQSQIWYGNYFSDHNIGIDADNEVSRKSSAFRKELRKLIDSGRTKVGKSSLRRKWQKISAKVRRDIEKMAVCETIRDYKVRGYQVKSVERQNKGWDLEASKNSKTLLLEVKGHRYGQIQFELTPNEYAKLKDKASAYRVCVVINALSKPKLMVFRPHSRNGKRWFLVAKNDSIKIGLQKIVSAKAVVLP